LTATKTNPVTQNVRLIVSSIATQLEAIGVKYHGLRKWNRTEPTTNKTNTIAKIIIVVTPVDWAEFRRR
jgi:hypothetical protein